MTAHCITVRNVNSALPEALAWLLVAGVRENSRNGPVLVAPGPMVTTYLRPQERVLFSPVRDANHWFHFFEALWMLAGWNDSRWLTRFNPRMSEYAEPDGNLHGAYGYRWRHWKGPTVARGEDQLIQLIALLRREPDTRRAVLQMWEPNADLNIDYRDLPCNTQCYIDLRGGALNLTATARSHDAIWGAYGANAVHFTVLQEYLAAAVGVPVGKFVQFSHNFHVYEERFPPAVQEALRWDAKDHYAAGVVEPLPLLAEGERIEQWEQELHQFMREGLYGLYDTRFFASVAVPMLAAWEQRKSRQGTGAAEVQRITASDWRLACFEWIHRREDQKRGEAQVAAR